MRIVQRRSGNGYTHLLSLFIIYLLFLSLFFVSIFGHVAPFLPILSICGLSLITSKVLFAVTWHPLCISSRRNRASANIIPTDNDPRPLVYASMGTMPRSPAGFVNFYPEPHVSSVRVNTTTIYVLLYTTVAQLDSTTAAESQAQKADFFTFREIRLRRRTSCQPP